MTNCSQHTSEDTGKSPALTWIEPMKGLAILAVVAYHLSLVLYPIPDFYHPFDHPKNIWPALGERLQTLQPLPGEGVVGLLNNASRYVGWLGYQGVHIFIVLSGIGLTWSLALRGGSGTLRTRAFYQRRLLRVFPQYWAAHLLFICFALAIGQPAFDLISRQFAMSFLGLRFTVDTFYYISAAWWYIGLILQLYLVFPLLWAWLCRFGLASFWIGTFAITLAARFFGLVVGQWQIELVSMGIFFPTRLFEFTFGMGVAYLLARQPQEVDRTLRSTPAVMASIVVYILGIVLSFTRAGAVMAPMLIAVGLFVLCHALLSHKYVVGRRPARALGWVGAISFSLYLLHLPINNWFVAVGPEMSSPLFLPLLLGLQGALLVGSSLFGNLVERCVAMFASYRATSQRPTARVDLPQDS